MVAKTALLFPTVEQLLYSIFKALSIKDKEIILSSYTCSVVAHAVTLSGNIPVFTDIDINTYNMDIKDLNKKISKNTKVIIITHLYGYACNIDEITKIKKFEKKFSNKIL